MREPAVVDNLAVLGQPWPEASIGHWVFRNRSWLPVPLGILAVVFAPGAADLRLGIVGTDTSHVTNFTRVLNDEMSPGARTVPSVPPPLTLLRN